MPYDEPFWARRRWRFGFMPHDPAWDELHDYDFEMRGPYQPGALVDAYIQWRRYRDEERREWLAAHGLTEDDVAHLDLTPSEELHRWRAWRRAHRPPGEEAPDEGLRYEGDENRRRDHWHEGTPFEEFRGRHRRRGNYRWPREDS